MERDTAMAVVLPDARELPDIVLDCLRWRAVHACELGYTEAEVAGILGVSRETVSRWWSAYCQGGVEAVPGERTGRPVGSGRLLSEEQAAHVQQLIDDHCPDDWGIAAPLWTRRAVRDLVDKEYGIALPLRTVGAYLRRWGYSPKKPRLKARHQDPEEVREWLENIYPAIVEAAEQEDGEIQWCDEKGVGANDYPGRGYAKVGQTPELTVASHPCRMNQIATVSNEGKVRFMTYKATMTAALFVEFLGRLIQGASRKIFLIVDRLPAHEANLVEAWLQGREDQIEMFYLPAGTPELNPVEYLNNDEKSEVNAAKFPENQQELRSHMQHFLHRLAHLPEHVLSYFQHRCINYAIEPV
jgi:transposase